MKWYEYIMARRIIKIMDLFENRKHKGELLEIQDKELKLDKGYWHFDEKQYDYIFVEQKKNEHFVTIKVNDIGKSCEILLSKKPLNIDSEKCDYPWDAERSCSIYAKLYRDLGYKIIVKRDAPILVADFDICCPYCFNSSSFREWASNSYQQELLTLPKKLENISDLVKHSDNIEIIDIATEKLWCPICNNGIEDRALLITKGDEWKASKIKDIILTQFTSPHINDIIQKQKAHTANEETSSINNLQKNIENPFNLVTDNMYGGLIVKRYEKVINNNKLIYKTKWIKPNQNFPSNFVLNEDISTSYLVKSNIDWVPKQNKNYYPIIYVPLADLPISKKLEDDEHQLQQLKELFHAGKPLDILRITPKKHVISKGYLLHLAYDLGISHIPTIVIGDWEEKKIIEDHYKERVKIEQYQVKFENQITEGKMLKAFGTFVKKGNRLFRTEAYIQFGEREDTLGTVIMLNPGSARLKSSIIEENKEIQDEISIDPTMEALIKIIDRFYENNKPVQGRLYVYNLFPLQNARSDEALRLFEQLTHEQEPFVTSLPKPHSVLLNHLKASPWILVGWGCGKSSESLNLVKEQWLNIIKQSKTPIIGKKGITSLNFYHPRPHLKSQQIEYRDELKIQYDQLFQEKLTFKTEGIQDQSWKRHIMYYKPVEDITIGNYKCSLFEINEHEHNINYKYRLICFIEGDNTPILALNYEQSSGGTCCFGASLEDGRINLGVAPSSMILLEFRKWALQNVSEYIKDIDTKLIYDKMKNYDPIKYDDSNNIIMDELMKKRIENISKKIREFDDRYEYFYISEYEELYEEFDVHAIPLTGIQIILLEVNERIELAAIEFSKNVFSIEQVFTWLQNNNVYFGDSEQVRHIIERCNSVLQTLRFKTKIIALYTHGNQTIELKNAEEMQDITSTHNLNFDKVDTTKSKKLQQGLTIVLNGKIVKEVPRIDFNLHQDMIISNGNIIKADYIDEFKGGVGFYRKEEPLPIAYMIDFKTTVHIDLYKKEVSTQICIVEHNYVVNFEVL